MKQLLALCCALAGMACTTATNSGQAKPGTVSETDRAAVIAVVQSVFDAMRTRDTTALRALIAPGTQLVSIRTVEGAAPRINVQPLSAFVTAIGSAPDELIERMWNPRVEVAGDLASLWAPYDFRRGTTFSHCDHDAVHLIRTPGGWKMAALTYTVVTTGCAAP